MQTALGRLSITNLEAVPRSHCQHNTDLEFANLDRLPYSHHHHHHLNSPCIAY